MKKSCISRLFVVLFLLASLAVNIAPAGYRRMGEIIDLALFTR